MTLQKRITNTVAIFFIIKSMVVLGLYSDLFIWLRKKMRMRERRIFLQNFLLLNYDKAESRRKWRCIIYHLVKIDLKVEAVNDLGEIIDNTYAFV
jgi:hypothetical protein